jgi:Acetyltransferases
MITEYKKHFEKEVEKLLKKYPYYIQWDDTACRRLVAIKGNKVVGIGSLWSNTIHPHREYLGIYVTPDFRRRGIATELYKQLACVSPTKNFQGTVQSQDTSAVSFLEKYGFYLVRKSFTPQLMERKYRVQSERNTNYYSYNELSKNQSFELIKIQMKNYKDFHYSINPLNEDLSIEKWRGLILEDLDQQFSYAYVIEGKVTAYILCYKTDNKDQIEIGYIGGREVDRLENYLSFYESCLNKIFHQFEKVYIEADDVDPFAFTVLNLFEYDKNKSFDTYVN